MEFQCFGSDSGKRHASGLPGSLWLKRARAEEREPMGMVLTGHQPGRAFTNSLRDPVA